MRGEVVSRSRDSSKGISSVRKVSKRDCNHTKVLRKCSDDTRQCSVYERDTFDTTQTKNTGETKKLTEFRQNLLIAEK